MCSKVNQLCIQYICTYICIHTLFYILSLTSATKVESEQGGKTWFGGRTADSFFHHTNSNKLSFGQIVTITPNSIHYKARLPSKTEDSAGSTAPPPPTQFGLRKISQIKHFYLQITYLQKGLLRITRL